MFIKKILLPNKKLTSNFGLGCSSLMSIENNLEREALIKLAIDNGILHFDLARYYGLGKAEEEFTKITNNISQEITISSKFGIIDSFSATPLKHNQNKLRKIINISKPIKILAKFLYSINSMKRNYSSENCKRSLKDSLSALNLKIIDIYFFHEPLASKQIDNYILSTLEELKSQSKIGAYGFSGNLNIIYNILKNKKIMGLEVIQFDEKSSNKFYLEKIQKLLGNKVIFKSRFGIIRTHLIKLNNLFLKNQSLCDLWSNKLKLNLKDKDDLCFALIASFLTKYPDDLLLYSTRKLKRLEKLLMKLNDPYYNKILETEFISFYDDIVK